MSKPMLLPICRSHLYLRAEAVENCIAECVRWIANRSKAANSLDPDRDRLAGVLGDRQQRREAARIF